MTNGVVRLLLKNICMEKSQVCKQTKEQMFALKLACGHLHGLTGSAIGYIFIAPGFKLQPWLCQNGVLSFTLPHYLWSLLGPFSLPCAQKWQ